MKNYEKTYEEFWRDIVEENGVVNMDQVKRELHDFTNVIEGSSKVYCNLTNGVISKPLTDPDVVISINEENKNMEIEEAIKEELESRTYKVSIYDENNKEKIINVHTTLQDEDGNIIIDLSEILCEINMKMQTKLIQKAISKVPKEKQTEETLELLKIMFELT